VGRLVRDVVAADGREVNILLPQDPAQAGVDQVASNVQTLAGYRVGAERMSGSKDSGPMRWRVK
jgi:phage terminase large subunit-like protein